MFTSEKMNLNMEKGNWGVGDRIDISFNEIDNVEFHNIDKLFKYGMLKITVETVEGVEE